MSHPEVTLRAETPQAAMPVAGTRRRCALDWPGLAAFAIYLALALLFFARGVLGRFSTAYIGQDVDPQLLMWLIAWWTHAIRHGLNPLYTRAMWAPHGLNLAWTTNMPLLSIALAPIVHELGPVVAYNIACLLAVALAGWCAFILCRYVTGAYWPSIAGGYVFGFSAFMLAQTAAHLVVLLVFPVPLFALLLIRRFRDDITPRQFVIGSTLALTAEFSLFNEIFATMTVLLAAAFAILIIVGSAFEKRRALEILPTVFFSYAVTALLISPYIYFMIALGYASGISHPPLLYSTDLLNLLIPTSAMELGRLSAFKLISGHFLGYIYEAGGYLGLPMILIAIAFARRNWNKTWARLLAVFTATVIVLSLGPFVVADGRVVSLAPGILLSILPLIGKALPARLMLYTFLGLALITAIWLSSKQEPRWLRVFGLVAIIAFTLPNLSSSFWTTAVDIPSFFGGKLYEQYLTRGETVVVLPYGYNGNSVLWQLESQWYFRMAGGNVGPPPLAFRRWPAVRAFYRVDNFLLPDAGNQLRAFLAAHQAHAVLVDDREAAVWQPLMATLNVTPIHAGGMTLYRVPPSDLASWKSATALEMETRADQAGFAALVLGAEAWLRSGRTLTSLTPAEALKPTALPEGWIIVPRKIQPPYAEGGLNLPRRAANPHHYAGMWLAANEGGTVQVGIEGWYPALRQVLDKYRGDAIDFTPRDLAKAAQSAIPNRRGMLKMSFSVAGLMRAAAIAASLERASTQDGFHFVPAKAVSSSVR